VASVEEKNMRYGIDGQRQCATLAKRSEADSVCLSNFFGSHPRLPRLVRNFGICGR